MKPGNPIEIYRRERILRASSTELIAYVYDAGIAATVRGDRRKALESLDVLIRSLRLDVGDLGMLFYRTYRGIQNLVLSGDYRSAGNALRELRGAWCESMGVE